MALSAEKLLSTWQRLSGYPGGARLFSAFLGRVVPYSGSIGARVDTLEAGRSRVLLPDRRANRNHLNSLHAIALVNVAELASGLALITSLPPGARGILTGFRVTYSKKARGMIAAESQSEVLAQVPDRRKVDVPVTLKNAEGTVVAEAIAEWTVGPA